MYLKVDISTYMCKCSWRQSRCKSIRRRSREQLSEILRSKYHYLVRKGSIYKKSWVPPALRTCWTSSFAFRSCDPGITHNAEPLMIWEHMLSHWLSESYQGPLRHLTSVRHDLTKTSQELRMLSSVTINCQITKIVMNSGSQLSEL